MMKIKEISHKELLELLNVVNEYIIYLDKLLKEGDSNDR